LLKLGANPNCSTRLEEAGVQTPLMQACKKKDVEFAKLLVEFGADVDFPHKMTSTTPLALACTVGSVELVKFLLDSGAGKTFLRNNE